jgi:hypothetical protein
MITGSVTLARVSTRIDWNLNHLFLSTTNKPFHRAKVDKKDIGIIK